MSMTLDLRAIQPAERSLPGRLLMLFRDRPFRVVLLLSIAWVLGITDLAMTLTYLMNIGMFEGNPMARWVIATGSPYFLAGFKLATMVLSSSILFWQRRRWQGEVGAWIAVIVLGRLTLHWFDYIAGTSKMTYAFALASADPSQCDGMWATFQ
ncbi:MAG: hypothetical protein COB69_05850 [Phycisphaera sp.]|nr:MAG: hypothetical protein COB69_05850 [Phycisphaera sp.]